MSALQFRNLSCTQWLVVTVLGGAVKDAGRWCAHYCVVVYFVTKFRTSTNRFTNSFS